MQQKFELLITKGQSGGNIHQFVGQFAKAEILKVHLGQQIMAKPGEEIESDGRQQEKVSNRLVAAGAQMFDGETVFGAFDQRFDRLPLIVAMKERFRVGLVSRLAGI